MKKLKYLILILLLSVLCIGIFPAQKQSYATSITVLDLTGQEFVAIGNFPEELTFVATLSSIDEYTADQITWTINSSSMTQSTIVNNSSTLVVPKTVYQNITSTTTWLVTAKINNSIYDTLTVTFDFTEITSVSLSGYPTYQDYSASISPITFILETEGYPASQTIEWYQKTYANKYTKLSATGSTYTFTPTLPGKYTFNASVNGIFAGEQTVEVGYKPVTNLVVKCVQATDNSNGLNRYIFSLEDINEFYDTSKINWYNKPYGLVQKGGSTYEFQAASYGDFYIYARFEDAENPENNVSSEFFPLSIKVDRTKEILIGCAVLFGVLSIFTIIGCIRMVKRDKIYY